MSAKHRSTKSNRSAADAAADDDDDDEEDIIDDDRDARSLLGSSLVCAHATAVLSVHLGMPVPAGSHIALGDGMPIQIARSQIFITR